MMKLEQHVWDDAVARKLALPSFFLVPAMENHNAHNIWQCFWIFSNFSASSDGKATYERMWWYSNLFLIMTLNTWVRRDFGKNGFIRLKTYTILCALVIQICDFQLQLVLYTTPGNFVLMLLDPFIINHWTNFSVIAGWQKNIVDIRVYLIVSAHGLNALTVLIWRQNRNSSIVKP